MARKGEEMEGKREKLRKNRHWTSIPSRSSAGRTCSSEKRNSGCYSAYLRSLDSCTLYQGRGAAKLIDSCLDT
eukprot:1344114-Amorphochlora_amoeboformis.AAC.1